MRLLKKIQTYPLIIVGLIACCVSACSYRFTNIDAALPGGLRTIALEAIYDTSGEILPHGLLWREIQLAIARNSRFRITNRNNADMLLRLHINSASIVPSGSPEVVYKIRKDPKPYNFEEPARPTDYDSMFLPSQFLKNETLALTVAIELWSIRERKIVFSSAFSETQEYNAVFSESTAPTPIQFVRSEEASQNVFLEMSRKISSRFLGELLTGNLAS